MGETINDIDFDDDDLYEGSSGEQDPQDFYVADVDDDVQLDGGTQQDGDGDGNDDDIITQLLHSKGIADPSKIKFENEDGNLEERSWDDLTNDERLNILSGNETHSSGLTQDEIALINHIRGSKMSVNDYLAYERQQGISEYASQEREPHFIVDDYTDDELFMLDLQTKIEDITDEELEEALQAAKTNESLFNKQIQGIRNEYKKLEQDRNEREQAIAEQEQQEKFQQFSNSVMQSINSFTSLGDLDINIEDEDADTLYDFITGTDAAGINHFAKALNDPNLLVRAAWFALYGEDVINSISDYYKKEIASASKSSYEKGLKEGKGGKSPDVIISPTRRKSNNKVQSIDDLEF